MDSSEDEEELFKPLVDRPGRGTRLRRSINARLGRKRIKRIKRLIKKREERKSERRLRSLTGKTRSSL